MEKEIIVKVEKGEIEQSGLFGGILGEGGARQLKIYFDNEWDGLLKEITFFDAGLLKKVRVYLTDDKKNEDNSYSVPIPFEVLLEDGVITYVIDGTKEGVRQRSVKKELKIKYAPESFGAEDGEEISQTEAEQLAEAINETAENLRVYTDEKSAETLDSARAYADEKTAESLTDAKVYTDEKSVDTLTDAKAYTDQKFAESLDSAKVYADEKSVDTLTDAKAYTDQKSVDTLTDAKAYSDNQDATMLNSARAYADEKTAESLTDAKVYTDQKSSETLENAKAYTDTKASQVQNYLISIHDNDMSGVNSRLSAVENKVNTTVYDWVGGDDILVANANLLNCIHDMGRIRSTLQIILENANNGDFIQVDFISGETPTTLTIQGASISDLGLVPSANTAYSLFFDWGRLSYDAETDTYTYGWRISYGEYTV